MGDKDYVIKIIPADLLCVMLDKSSDVTSVKCNSTKFAFKEKNKCVNFAIVRVSHTFNYRYNFFHQTKRTRKLQSSSVHLPWSELHPSQLAPGSAGTLYPSRSGGVVGNGTVLVLTCPSPCSLLQTGGIVRDVGVGWIRVWYE